MPALDVMKSSLMEEIQRTRQEVTTKQQTVVVHEPTLHRPPGGDAALPPASGGAINPLVPPSEPEPAPTTGVKKSEGQTSMATLPSPSAPNVANQTPQQLQEGQQLIQQQGVVYLQPQQQYAGMVNHGHHQHMYAQPGYYQAPQPQYIQQQVPQYQYITAPHAGQWAAPGMAMMPMPAPAYQQPIGQFVPNAHGMQYAHQQQVFTPMQFAQPQQVTSPPSIAGPPMYLMHPAPPQ